MTEKRGVVQAYEFIRQCLVQAILPLRGKILNIERKDEAAIYKNEEIQNLILGLGLGVKVKFFLYYLLEIKDIPGPILNSLSFYYERFMTWQYNRPNQVVKSLFILFIVKIIFFPKVVGLCFVHISNLWEVLWGLQPLFEMDLRF